MLEKCLATASDWVLDTTANICAEAYLTWKDHEKRLTFLTDTWSTLSFSAPAAMAIEMGVSGMPFDKSILARAISLPVNLSTGGMYGKYRKWFWEKANTTEESPFIAKYLADTGAFATFQSVLYTGVLRMSGADWNETLLSVGTVTLTAVPIGRMMGAYMDKMNDFTRYCQQHLNRGESSA